MSNILELLSYAWFLWYMMVIISTRQPMYKIIDTFAESKSNSSFENYAAKSLYLKVDTISEVCMRVFNLTKINEFLCDVDTMKDCLSWCSIIYEVA